MVQKRVISRPYLIKVWHIVEAVTLVSSKDGLAAGYKGSEGPQVCSFDVGFVVLLNNILKYVLGIQPERPV